MNKQIFLQTILNKSSELYLSGNEILQTQRALNQTHFVFYDSVGATHTIQYLANNFLNTIREKFPDEYRLIYAWPQLT